MRAAYFGFVVVSVLSRWPQIVISLISGFHQKRMWQIMRQGNGSTGNVARMLWGEKPKSRKQKLIPACIPTDMRLANTVQPKLLGHKDVPLQGGVKRSSVARVRNMLKGNTKEECKVKRTQFAKERVQRKRFQGQTLLEQEVISKKVAIDYQHRSNEFLVHVNFEKLSIRGLTNLDSAFAEFLNHMFLEGTSVGEASKMMAAVLDSHPECGRKTSFLRSTRYLQGWHRLDPPHTR